MALSSGYVVQVSGFVYPMPGYLCSYRWLSPSSLSAVFSTDISDAIVFCDKERVHNIVRRLNRATSGWQNAEKYSVISIPTAKRKTARIERPGRSQVQSN